MNKLIEIIAEKYNVKKSAFGGEVFFFDIETPAVKFRHYIAQYDFEDKVFCFSQKDHFSDGFAEEVIDRVGKRLSEEGDITPLSVFDFHSKKNKFMDRVVLLGEGFHRQFMSDVPEVYPYAYAAFPCHHSEFTEYDTPDDVHYVRGKMVPTLDWFRSPCPRVRIWFELCGEGGRMHSSHLHLSSDDFLNDLLRERAFSNGGIVKIEKYSKDVMDLKFENGEAVFKDRKFDEAGSLCDFVMRWLRK